MSSRNQFDILAEQLAAAGASAAVRLTAKSLMEFGMRRPGRDLWPSIDSIAQRAGHSRSTVKRHLHVLEQAGIIRIEDRSKQRKSNRYSFPAVVREVARNSSKSEPLSSGPSDGGESEPLSSGPKSEPRVSMRDDAAPSASPGGSARAAEEATLIAEAQADTRRLYWRGDHSEIVHHIFFDPINGTVELEAELQPRSDDDPDIEPMDEHDIANDIALHEFVAEALREAGFDPDHDEHVSVFSQWHPGTPGGLEMKARVAAAAEAMVRTAEAFEAEMEL